jgi:Rap1a immunity proteins
VLPSIAFAVNDAPSQTGAFLAYCKTNSEGCADKIAGIYAAMLVNQTINPGNRKWCSAKEANDMKILVPKVMGWLSAHSEANSNATNDGIEMAIIQLYPCKR